MAAPVNLPGWPPGTVVTLVTAGARPHAIPVSAALRAGPDRVLLGLARSRTSLARLRADPAVTLAVCAEGLAFSADGRARIVREHLTERVAAVLVEISELHDHRRPTFVIDAAVAWRWTDEQAAAADAEVHTALRALAG